MRVIYNPRGNVHIKAASEKNEEVLNDNVFGPMCGLGML
jgi:hypothetical protein